MTAARARVLVVDDDEGIRKMLRLCLEGAGYEVVQAASGELAVAVARRTPPDVALVDFRMEGMDGLAVTRTLAQDAPTTRVIVMTAYATISHAVEAMRAGAVDYLPKPFTPSHVLLGVEKALETARMARELAELRKATRRGTAVHFDTRSPAMAAALTLVSRAAVTDATVLMLGETGTGKGVLARHLHGLSPRAQRPFVTVNCAVMASSLIETELFGHARGAYTGADGTRAGYIEVAGNGTLFLDEVGDLPREVQGKLLRLLEEREYVRVGETEARRTEARVIAATHRDLRAMVSGGTFREDLLYRLDVLTVRVPPLRERAEDLDGLATALVTDLCARNRRPPMDLPPETLTALGTYRWPGNLRELANVLERAVILAAGDALTLDLLPEEIRAAVPLRTSVNPEGDDSDETLEAAERRHIAAVLARHPTLDGAARALGVDPSTLYRKRERHGLLKLGGRKS